MGQYKQILKCLTRVEGGPTPTLRAHCLLRSRNFCPFWNVEQREVWWNAAGQAGPWWQRCVTYIGVLWPAVSPQLTDPLWQSVSTPCLLPTLSQMTQAKATHRWRQKGVDISPLPPPNTVAKAAEESHSSESLRECNDTRFREESECLATVRYSCPRLVERPEGRISAHDRKQPVPRVLPVSGAETPEEQVILKIFQKQSDDFRLCHMHIHQGDVNFVAESGEEYR
ncbi:hypothetical protein MHYP_G00147030 [Metynnis hypsauchen]